MPIVVVANEKNFAALRPRVFAGTVSDRTAKDVTEAVRKANPHVDLEKLEPGTVLTIPDSPAVRAAGDLSVGDTAQEAVGRVVEAGKSTLDEVAARAAKQESAARTERAQVLKSLDAIGTTTTRPREKGMAKDIQDARDALAAEDELAKQRSATVKKAVGEWKAGLDALREIGPDQP